VSIVRGAAEAQWGEIEILSYTWIKVKFEEGGRFQQKLRKTNLSQL
jgi:hypothetical protein